MGAINYATSDVITLVCNDITPDDLIPNLPTEKIAEIEAEIHNEFVHKQAQEAIENYEFDYFFVDLKSGYYDGMQLLIEKIFDGYIYDAEDKKKCLKEAENLKNMMELLAKSYGFVKCVPGWCPAYSSQDETLEEIENAINLLKKEIINTEFEQW